VNVAYVDYVPGTPKAVIRLKTKEEATRLIEGELYGLIPSVETVPCRCILITLYPQV